MKTLFPCLLATVLAAVLLLAACAAPSSQHSPETALEGSGWAKQSTMPGAQSVQSPWRHYALPGKVPTRYVPVREDGRQAIEATSSSAASLLRQTVHVAPDALGSLHFSWKVPALTGTAGMARKETDDAPVRIILAFDGDRSRLSGKDQMLSELTRAVMGDDMPYATLMYVWSRQRAPGTIITNPRTDRIHKLVVESGAAHLDHWIDYERDVRADYERAFGEAPGPLIGIGIMTDTDNTHSQAQAWYGPVILRPPAAASR